MRWGVIMRVITPRIREFQDQSELEIKQMVEDRAIFLFPHDRRPRTRSKTEAEEVRDTQWTAERILANKIPQEQFQAVRLRAAQYMYNFVYEFFPEGYPSESGS